MTPHIAFANPWIGLAGILLILSSLFGLKLLHKKKLQLPIALIYPKTEIMGGALREYHSSLSGKKILHITRICTLILIAAAMARPQKVMVQELEPIHGVDIMLVLDTSTSMQALDFQPLNRLDAVKEIAADFISKRKGDRIGLIAFGGSAVLHCPLTLDHQAVLSFLKQIEIGSTQTQGTAIGTGLMTALTHLRRVPSKSKLIVLMTDGRNNAGSVDPASASKLAQSLGIKIYSVGAGKRGGGIFPIQDPIFGTRYVRIPEEEIDEETLTKISLSTGGKYYRATEMSELKNIFNEIDLLEKTALDAPREVHYEDLYPPLLLGALLLLGSEALLKATVLFSMP